MILMNSVVAVTGAAQGIGYHFALRALKAGARVAISDVNSEILAEIRESLTEIGRDRVLVQHCDVASQDSVNAWAEAVQSQFGRVDLLVNNAAAQHVGPGSLDNVDFERHRLSFEVNVLGNLRTIDAFLPKMRACKSGYIVNTASSLAIRPNAVIQHLMPYVTSKGAVLTQTWALAYALRDSGIRVSLFCPGLTATREGQTMTRAQQMGWFKGVREDLAAPASVHRAIDIFEEGLQREAFLISSDEGYQDSIVRFARRGLDPLSDYH